MCDFTIAGQYQIALSLDWNCLTQCDMGNLVCLARTVKKSKPVVLFSAGCGENSGGGEEATDKQMAAMMKRMSLSSSTAAELIAVLLAIAGPEFLHTYSTYATPFDVERWTSGDEDESLRRLYEAGELLKEGEEIVDEKPPKRQK